jgi:hypothetical protein
MQSRETVAHRNAPRRGARCSDRGREKGNRDNIKGICHVLMATRWHTSWYVCRPSGAGCHVWADSRGFTPVSGPVPLRGTFSGKVPISRKKHREPPRNHDRGRQPPCRLRRLGSHYPGEGLSIVSEMSKPRSSACGAKERIAPDAARMLSLSFSQCPSQWPGSENAQIRCKSLKPVLKRLFVWRLGH